MRNKIILTLIGLIFAFGTYEALYLMYVATEPIDLGIRENATNVEYASYVYLFSSIVMSLLLLFLREISLNAKRILTFLVTLFYIFSWILALITFYSNPNSFRRSYLLYGRVTSLGKLLFYKSKRE